MKRRSKKKMIIIFIILLGLFLIYRLPKILVNKQIRSLPEVKLKKSEVRNKSLAIMISKDNGETYEEYKSEDNKWPDSSYEYKYAKCIDNNGNEVDNNIEFNKETRQVSLETDKTIYCTLYFDKYNYMKVPLNNGLSDFVTSDIKNVYFVNYIDTSKSVNTWDLSDTTTKTDPNSVMAWTEVIDGDSNYKNLYIGSKAKIKAISLGALFATRDENVNVETIDFGNMLDTSDTISMGTMFSGQLKLTQIKGIEKFDTSNVTSFAGMFWDCQSLESIDLNSWHTESLERADNMFVRNYKLKNVNIKNWNTKKLINTGGMFHRCVNLTSLDLSGWETQLIENVNTMFIGCSSLKNIDMRKATFTQITENYTNMFNGVPNTAILIVKDNAQKQWIQDTASATQFKGTIQIGS